MKKILLVSALTFPMLSNAETLFYCKTTKGKQVKVEKHGEIFSYAFGKSLKKPELALRKKASEVSTETEAYSGGGATVITITNDGYRYELRSGIIAGDWNADGTRNHEDFGSIQVYKGEKELAELTCIPSTMK